MTNLNLTHAAVSVIATLITTVMFISAAVGPAVIV